MRRERLSCAEAAKLVRLDAGESLPRSQVTRGVLLPLQKAGVVMLEKSGSSYVVRGLPGKLRMFAAQHWGVLDLARYAEATPDSRSRGMLTEIAGDSKALPSRPLGGVFIRSFSNCFLADKPLGSSPPGSAVLVSLAELPKLSVEAPYLVAVENAECLWSFEKAERYFPALTGLKYALVLRWHWGDAWCEWLKGWKGGLLYFPDYDPAGLRIFVTEVLPKAPSVRLLVPRDFEKVLEQRGKRGLYVRQEGLLSLVESASHPDLVRVCVALRKSRKGLEQESLLW